MYQASLRLNYDSFYAKVTDKTDVTMDLWCNNHCDILYITGDDKKMVFEQLDDHIGIQNTIRRQNELMLVTEECLLQYDTEGFESFLDHYNCIALPPQRYEQGHLQIQVVAIDEKNLSELYTFLNNRYTVTVTKKQEVNTYSPDTPIFIYQSTFPDLSERQQDAIRAAHKQGYYEIPRGCKTEDIATQLGVKRRTAEEHLRVAEKKIINWFVKRMDRKEGSI